jgi:hypothetical protein
MTSDINRTIEATFYQLELIKQVIRGIAHRGATGCFRIEDIESEVLQVEEVIDGVQAVLEKAGEALVKRAAA